MAVCTRINGLALCAGIGGLELGLKRAIPGYKTVCYVEQNAFAASTLVARMEEKALDQAPIWDDITTFNGTLWNGSVDILSAGFPCQPFSLAGKRRGIKDGRWIFDAILRIAKECGKPNLFFENVPGIISMGLEHILRSLAEMGYHAKWGCFTAKSVGAPHKRDRWFMFAHTKIINDRINKYEGQREKEFRGYSGWLPEPNICRVDDGITYRMDRLYCLGNAVVPQQAEIAFRMLNKC